MTSRDVLGLALVAGFALGGLGGVGCGKQSAADSPIEDDPIDLTDGGDPDVVSDGSASGDSGGGGGGGTDADPGGSDCLKLGALCGSAGDCCSGTCTDQVCAVPACTSDQGACSSDGECCGGKCEDGTCAPLNTSCKTLGNACAAASECCSGRCADGTCQPSSFCGQVGDACEAGTDCCGGICNIASGSKGTCSKPSSGSANCQFVDGELCSGGATVGDGGVPACGGECCSRACAPWGPTGVFVCQPASGCRVVGDTCTKDGDCCGSAGMPGTSGLAKPVTCNIAPGQSVGVCRNPQGCAPDGAVCKLATSSCNATCDCCSGNCNQVDVCRQDSLGVPRCAAAECVQPGGACASSANCCNGLPCVPNPGEGAPFICYEGGSCVPKCGACTTNADCCPGSSCITQPGSSQGVCGPCEGDAGAPDGGVEADGGVSDGGSDSGSDAGKPCALFGQQCTTDGDCCNDVPCTNGTCHYDIR